MCLQAFLQKHTRHLCHFIDCRLMEDLEDGIVSQIQRCAPPRIVVMNAQLLALGQIGAVLEIVKRHFPAIRTVLFGEFPSAFPEHVQQIPRVDFALAGDPEPILRNLLDYVDVEQRLRRTPGLIIGREHKSSPYWLPKLHSLAVPEWDTYFWHAYNAQAAGRSCRAAIRLTRGHDRTPNNRACGEMDQPLRQWPLEAMAKFLSRCSHTEIKEVLITDAPSFWTESVLADWVQHLLRIRNAQPWAFAMHPRVVSDELIRDLRETQCKRIDFIFPTCDRDRLHTYGIHVDWRSFSEMSQQMQAYGIQVNPRFYIGGPEEGPGEARRVAGLIHRLRFCDYRIEPYPYVIDAPVYDEYNEADETPTLEAWIKWAREPWLQERPLPVWRGSTGIQAMRKKLKTVERTLQKSPHLAWTRMRRVIRSTNWIEYLEDKALDFLRRRRSSTP